ncbi:MAG: T9SS type A sorting domain-containing protein [Cyclobacteriaceae bacterium]
MITFCNTNQSKNFTIEGLGYNPDDCNYHYRYTYEVPSGWIVNPVTGSDIDGAPNVAKTFDKSVTITAPSSVSNGKAGVLKVRTNHPSSTIQSENVIDIQFGTYTSSQVTVSGQTAVCPGNQYVYTASPSGSSYSWTYPSGWSKISQAGNQVTLSVPFNNNQYGAVRVSITNACGASAYSGVTVFPGYSCGSYLMAGDFKIYPNPAEDQLSIELTNDESLDEGESLSSENSTEPTFTVLIYNKQQRLMVEDAISGNKKELDISAFPPDTYILHIEYQGKMIKEQIVIR